MDIKEKFAWKCGHNYIDVATNTHTKCSESSPKGFGSVAEASSDALRTHYHKDSTYVYSLNKNKYIGLAQGLVFNQK